MPTKREERRERSEAQKLDRERQIRRKKLQSRAALIFGTLAFIAIALIVRHQRQIENEGRIWSSAHGHWHDRYGMEIR